MLHSFLYKNIVSISTLLFSLFPSLLLQPTLAKFQSKVKQYDLICYSNALKSTTFLLNQNYSFCSVHTSIRTCIHIHIHIYTQTYIHTAWRLPYLIHFRLAKKIKTEYRTLSF